MTKGKKKETKQAKNRGLVKFSDIKGLMKILQQPTIKIAEFLTGVLVSELKDWKLSAGRLVQSVIKGNLLTQLGREIKKYQMKGEIKEDYLENNINQACFKEILTFIDSETPDEIRFRAMKSIFFCSISKDTKLEDQILAYQLMQICKQLSSGEILILKAIWDMRHNRIKAGVTLNPSTTRAREWLKNIALQIGHNLPHLVELHERKLIELSLITSRTYPDRSGITHGSFYRLTDLGVKLCEFITRYE